MCAQIYIIGHIEGNDGTSTVKNIRARTQQLH